MPTAKAMTDPPKFLSLFEPSDSQRLSFLVSQQVCCCCDAEKIHTRVLNWLRNDLQHPDPTHAAAATRRLELTTGNEPAAIAYCNFVLQRRSKQPEPTPPSKR